VTGPAPASGGLVHLGLVYDGPDDLVRQAVPELRRRIAAGDAVYVTADRATVRRVREELGPAGEHVEYPPPSTMVTPSAPAFLPTVRRWAGSERRTTVLGCYPASMSAADCGFGEDALNAVLGDLPLTLICCCRRDLDPGLLAVARRTHPLLATPVGTTDNPDYRAPATASPAPAALWGAVAGRVDLDGTGDLAELRRCVAAAAGRTGLEGDAVRAAVLAVHEAAVLAVRRRDPDGPGLVVEIRAEPGRSLFSEIVGPRAPLDDHLDGDQTDPLGRLRPFCTEALVLDDAEHRAVRVLSTM
jgi:hypothetical protein